MTPNTIIEIRNLKIRLNEDEKKISDLMSAFQAKNRSDIDFMAMEAGIDLDQDSEE